LDTSESGLNLPCSKTTTIFRSCLRFGGKYLYQKPHIRRRYAEEAARSGGSQLEKFSRKTSFPDLCDFFMDSTMVNHHYSPPFWENMFLWRAPYLGGFSMIFETDGWKNVPRILNILKEVETTKYQYQVAQAVTFLSPNL